jgi:hypothetical protein
MMEVGQESEYDEGVEAVTSGDHGTSGKIPYGEPPGIKFHGTMVFSGEVTNREKILYVVGGNKDVVEVQRIRKNRVAY